MAVSRRAHAQSQHAPNHVDAASPDLDELALQACDDADNLNDVMRAYTALEKLIDPVALADSEVLPTSRTELSALLRLLNGALLDRIGTVNAATGAVHEALQHNSTLSAP
jgi:hypothetical protein